MSPSDSGFHDTSHAAASLPTVPGFHIIRPIGAGGFSVVYEAIQDVVEAPVALKVLTALDTGDPKARERFLRECKLMGRLRRTPGIAWINQAAFTTDGRPVIVMELFDGGTVADRVSTSGPMPVPDVLAIGIRVAEALDAAHRLGISHRDVKPENLLIASDGAVALADFGIALVAGVEANTQTLGALSPSHAPPERIEPDLAPEDPVRCDVYSLGSTLYTMLAGHTPFDDGGRISGYALLGRIIKDPPPPLARDDLPPGLATTLERSLAKRPEERFASAAEFATALRRLARLGDPEGIISEGDIRARGDAELGYSLSTAQNPTVSPGGAGPADPGVADDSWWQEDGAEPAWFDDDDDDVAGAGATGLSWLDPAEAGTPSSPGTDEAPRRPLASEPTVIRVHRSDPPPAGWHPSPAPVPFPVPTPAPLPAPPMAAFVGEGSSGDAGVDDLAHGRSVRRDRALRRVAFGILGAAAAVLVGAIAFTVLRGDEPEQPEFVKGPSVAEYGPPKIEFDYRNAPPGATYWLEKGPGGERSVALPLAGRVAPLNKFDPADPSAATERLAADTEYCVVLSAGTGQPPNRRCVTTNPDAPPPATTVVTIAPATTAPAAPAPPP